MKNTSVLSGLNVKMLRVATTLGGHALLSSPQSRRDWMAFKRSAVRSRLSPPTPLDANRVEFFLEQTGGASEKRLRFAVLFANPLADMKPRDCAGDGDLAVGSQIGLPIPLGKGGQGFRIRRVLLRTGDDRVLHPDCLEEVRKGIVINTVVGHF